MKIGLLLLTVGDFIQSEFWDKWLKLAEKEGFKLFTHTTSEISSPIVKASIIDADYVLGTTWGTMSLPDATKSLAEFALKDDDSIEKFILLSESHFPLWSPKEMREKIESLPKGFLFSPMSSMGSPRAFRRMFDNFLPEKFREITNTDLNLQIAHQWWLADRDSLSKIVENYSSYRSYFDTKKVGNQDELIFLFAARGLGLQVSEYSNCYVDFLFGSSEEDVSKGERKFPATINWINMERLASFRSEGFLFARKVSPILITDKPVSDLILI